MSTNLSKVEVFDYISKLRHRAHSRGYLVIGIDFLKKYRRVIPLVYPDYVYPVVGCAMILDLSKFLKRKRLMLFGFNTSQYPSQIVITYKFNNPPSAPNKYELGQYIRMAFSCYARFGESQGYKVAFPIFKILNNQLRPRSQWIKFLDETIKDSLYDDVNLVNSSMNAPVKESTISFLGKNNFYLENVVDVSTLYPGSEWVDKVDEYKKVRVISHDDDSEIVEFVFLNDKTGNVYKMSSVDFLSKYRYKIRDKVFKKTPEVMRKQVEVYVNEILTDCLKRAYFEYYERFKIKLADETQISTLIDLGGTSLSAYGNLGRYAAILAQTIVDNIVFKKPK